MSQGQSALTTELKQRGLGYACKVNATVFKANPYHSRFHYFHFDLHSGCGVNEKAGCIGSPIAFISAMEEAGIDKYHAGFCDKDGEAVKGLLGRVAGNHRCFVHHGDNREYLYTIPGVIEHYRDNPDKAIGSVLCDPNGADIPTTELHWLNSVCPRMDVIIHFNSTQSKREAHGVKPDTHKLLDVIDGIGKKHWLIRRPNGVHQFTLLIGRNVKFGDFKSQGFYHLDSPEGYEISRICHMSKAQYMNESGQMGLLL